MSDGPVALPRGLTGTLVLVRHGESVWVAEGRFQGRGDPALSRLGLRQAELVADRLARPSDGAPLPIPAGPPLGVWHSPLARAAQTARIIAERQPGPVSLFAAEGFSELAQGEWEGLAHSEVSQRWPELLARWRSDPTSAQGPGGEPLVEAAARVRAALSELLATLAQTGRQSGGEPAADEAGDLAALARSPVPGYPTVPSGERVGPPEPWAVLVAHDGILRLLLMTLLGVPYERFWSFPFNLCAVSVLSLSEGVATLRAHNLAEHLAPLAAQELAAEEARGDRRGAL